MVNVQEMRNKSALIGVIGITIGCIVGPASTGAKAYEVAMLGWAALVAGIAVFMFPIIWIPWHEMSVKASIGNMAENIATWADYGDGHAESTMWCFPEFDEYEVPASATNLEKSERFRRFVWAESIKDTRIRKIGNPVLPKVYCPNKDCRLAADAGTMKCPACGTAFPKLQLTCPLCRAPIDAGIEKCPACGGEIPKPQKVAWKTPDMIKKEIEDALKKVSDFGGITVYRGKLNRPWVRMDGRDWFEKITIVIPKNVDWNEYFGDAKIMLSPFVEFGMLVGVKCHYAHVEKLCNSESGQPIFLVKDSAWELHKTTQNAQNQLKESDVAIATLVSLNGAENKDVAVVQEREEKNEAKNEAHFWKVKHTLKQLELDTVQGQHIRGPADRPNRGVWALFATTVMSVVFAFLFVFTLVVK